MRERLANKNWRGSYFVGSPLATRKIQDSRLRYCGRDLSDKAVKIFRVKMEEKGVYEVRGHNWGERKQGVGGGVALRCKPAPCSLFIRFNSRIGGPAIDDRGNTGRSGDIESGSLGKMPGCEESLSS